MMTDIHAELVALFKALSDSNRLKIIGLLAQQPYSVEQLAALLEIKPSTVSHHLSRLAEVELVSAHAESYYNVYQLNEAALQKARLLFSQQDLPAVAAGVDSEGYDRKVISDYTQPDGKLKTIPTQRKKLEVILRHVIREFQVGRRYTEAQVNEILFRFHEDVASLRRELVGVKLMEREGDGGSYWRPPKES